MYSFRGPCSKPLTAPLWYSCPLSNGTMVTNTITGTLTPRVNLFLPHILIQSCHWSMLCIMQGEILEITSGLSLFHKNRERSLPDQVNRPFGPTSFISQLSTRCLGEHIRHQDFCISYMNPYPGVRLEFPKGSINLTRIWVDPGMQTETQRIIGYQQLNCSWYCLPFQSSLPLFYPISSLFHSLIALLHVSIQAQGSFAICFTKHCRQPKCQSVNLIMYS